MLLAFGEFWKRYVDFKGKTDRRTFWLTVLAELLVLFICGLSHALLATYLYESDSLPYLLIALCCAMLVPTAALMVRRLRDAGYAWGWVFLFFLSLPGWIALAVLSAKPSGAKRKTAAHDSEPVALKTAPESRRKADEQILANPQGGDCTTKAETRSAPKKNRIWLWIVGWIFVYPVPVTLLLRRSRLRSFGKTALIILAWIPYFTSIVLAFGNSERPATSGEQETFLSNAELLTEVYPTLQQIDACEKSESAPAATENFLILRLDEKRQKIIAKNINGDHKLSEQLTRADAEALDLIVVAVTDSFTRLYAPYANGERLEGTVTKRQAFTSLIRRPERCLMNPASGHMICTSRRAAIEDSLSCRTIKSSRPWTKNITLNWGPLSALCSGLHRSASWC